MCNGDITILRTSPPRKSKLRRDAVNTWQLGGEFTRGSTTIIRLLTLMRKVVMWVCLRTVVAYC